MASSKKAVKQKVCFIVTRYFIKKSGSVCCIVRNETGKDYTTCVHANGSTSCNCPATVECYHIRHVKAVEAARKAQQAFAQAATITAQPGQTPVTPKSSTMPVASPATPCKGNALPAATLAKGMQLAASKPVVTAPALNKVYSAPLHSNQGFSLMRR